MSTSIHADGQWTERCTGQPDPSALEPQAFRRFFERSVDPIWILDPHTSRVLECNQAAVELLGADTKAALLGLRPADVSPPVQPDGSRSTDRAAILTALARAQGGARFEWELQRLDGRTVPVEVVSTRIPVGDGDVFFVVSRDIRQRRETETALAEQEQLLASVADHVREAIYRSGPDHELMFVNRAYRQLFGYPSLEALRQIPREQLYADPTRRAALLRRLTEEGGFENEEVEFRRRDGSTFWGLANAVVIRDPRSGRPLYHVGSITDITERKQAADAVRALNATLEERVAERTAALQASEARFRTLVEHAPEAIVVFDGETGRFLDANEKALRLYGITRERLLACGPADVSPGRQPDGRTSTAAARDWIDRALAGEAPVFEWVHRRPNGALVPCEVRLVRLPDAGRSLVRGSITDNTERRRRERIQQATFEISEAVHTTEDLGSLFRRVHESVMKLMPAHNFYLALLDAASGMFDFPYFVDQRDTKPAPMRLTSGLTGYVLRTGKPLLVNRASPIEKPEAGLAHLLAEGQDAVYAEKGSPAAVWLGVPLRVRGQLIGVMAVQDYENDQAYGPEEMQILGFVAEQTALAIERKRAEQALRESEEKFRALFAATGQGVMLHDEERFLEVNPAAVRIMGHQSADTLVGHYPHEFAPPCQPDGQPSDLVARRHIDACLATGTARFDWAILTPSGGTVQLEVLLTRIPMGGRQIIQAVVNDITQRKQAEAELLRALAREKELGELKSNFVSLVSHEFRTPLGIIMSSAEILRDYLDQLAPDERAQHLNSIQKSTRRMAELMEEVLLLGRFEAGRMDLRPEPLDLAALARRLLEEVAAATHRVCPIRLDVGPGFDHVTADERLLRHIFTNLLSNAVKYSPPGHPVDFTFHRDGPDAVAVVRDHGLGIPSEDREWLFRAFHRGRNIGDRPGTGLGLVIVKRCLELHGGGIDFQSTVGEGTTFTVRLPLFASAAAPHAPVPVPTTVSAPL